MKMIFPSKRYKILQLDSLLLNFNWRQMCQTEKNMSKNMKLIVLETNFYDKLNDFRHLEDTFFEAKQAVQAA